MSGALMPWKGAVIGVSWRKRADDQPGRRAALARRAGRPRRRGRFDVP